MPTTGLVLSALYPNCMHCECFNLDGDSCCYCNEEPYSPYDLDEDDDDVEPCMMTFDHAL